MKSLLAAAVVIALALSPSIGECVRAQQEQHANRYLLFGWAALVIILAIVAGEEILAGA